MHDVAIKSTLVDEKGMETMKFLPHCRFAQGIRDPTVPTSSQVKSIPDIQKVLTGALTLCNDELPVMNLVLFQDAIEHM